MTPMADVVRAAALALVVESPQTAVLPGEPVKLAITWQANEPVRDVEVETKDFAVQSLVFLVTNRSGERLYVEYPRVEAMSLISTISLTSGERFVQNLVLFRGGYLTAYDGRRRTDRALFPETGRYTLRVAAIDRVRRVPLVLSNAISFVVEEPTSDDRDVLERIAGRDRWILDGTGDDETQALLRKLTARYPESRYLRWARLRLLEARGHMLHNWYDPDSGEFLPEHLDKEEIARIQVKQCRQMADDLLGEEWGPFEEEALLLALRYARASGNEDAEQQARTRLAALPLKSSAAMRSLAPDEAPVLR